MSERYLEIYNKYVQHHAILKNIAERLETHLIEYVGDYPRIDRISVRVKDPDRFVNKALKEESGNLKYKSPFVEIQDQIGARIITYYLEDVEKITRIIKDYYEQVEIKVKEPESHKEFSYFGKHFIIFIPDEIQDEGTDLLFFELQIKTLFQHAWSEAEHDLNYKTSDTISLEDKRSIAFTSAQAWGADKLFNDLYKKYNN